MKTSYKISIIATFLLLWLSSIFYGCQSNKLVKKTKTFEEYNSKLVSRYYVDTTFTFYVVSPFDSTFSSKRIMLPEEIGWEKYSGMSDVYAIISETGQIVDLEVVELLLFDESNEKLICNCSNSLPDHECNWKKLSRLSGYQSFHSFLLSQLRSFKLIQNSNATSQKHRAFYRFEFGYT